LARFILRRVQLRISERGKMDGQESVHQYKRRSIIKCECGYEILVTPEMNVVGNIIDAHVEEHRRKQKDPAKGEIAAQQIQDYLIKKLFEKIAQMPI
jgi:hypothetical protein